jgi:hypothetical protein
MLDAEAILRCLARHRVEHVVVGAFAATLQGSPLRTDDVDVCPDPGRRNLDRLGAALRELNAKEWDPRNDELVERTWGADRLMVDSVLVLVTDRGRLDLVFKPAGYEGFHQLANSSVTIRIDDLELRVAALEDVIRSKEILRHDHDLVQLPTLRRLIDLRDEEE